MTRFYDVCGSLGSVMETKRSVVTLFRGMDNTDNTDNTDNNWNFNSHSEIYIPVTVSPY